MEKKFLKENQRLYYMAWIEFLGDSQLSQKKNFNSPAFFSIIKKIEKIWLTQFFIWKLLFYDRSKTEFLASIRIQNLNIARYAENKIPIFQFAQLLLLKTNESEFFLVSNKYSQITLSPARIRNESITCSAVSVSVVSRVMKSRKASKWTYPVLFGSTTARIRWKSISPYE